MPVRIVREPKVSTCLMGVPHRATVLIMVAPERFRFSEKMVKEEGTTDVEEEFWHLSNKVTAFDCWNYESAKYTTGDTDHSPPSSDWQTTTDEDASEDNEWLSPNLW